jgi:hypothetical protein
VSPRDWNDAAGRIWPHLTTAAKHRETVTYGDLAAVVDTNAQSVGRALDPIKQYCERQKLPLPPLTCIVVRAYYPYGPGPGCGLRPGQVPAAQSEVFRHAWDAVLNPFANLGCEEGTTTRDASMKLPCTPSTEVNVPSAKELQNAVDTFDAQWGGVDEMLYETCARFVDHSPRSLMTKCILIDRAYSAGLDRQVGAPEGGRSVDNLFGFAKEHAEAMAALAGELGGQSEPLTEKSLLQVLVEHGKLCSLLSESLTDGDRPRSFVSKLLHFHCPIVPIMDSDCDRNLRKRVPHPAPLSFKRPAEADAEYFSFCRRFYSFYRACRAVRPSTTVRDLDAFLWTPPGFPGWDS